MVRERRAGGESVSIFSLEELERDRYETIEDIQNCEFALSQGTTHYCDGQNSVQERLDVNKQILTTIENEMEKLGVRTPRPNVPKPVYMTRNPQAADAVSALVQAIKFRNGANKKTS